MEQGGTIIHADDACAYGVAGAVVVVVGRRRPSLDVARRADAVLARVAAQQPGAFAYLAVIEPTSEPPEPVALDQLRNTIDAFPEMRAVVAVLEGQPSWTSAGVDIVLDIAEPRRGRRDAKVCTHLGEALVWLGRRSEPALTPAVVREIEPLVERLRAAMPPA